MSKSKKSLLITEKLKKLTEQDKENYYGKFPLIHSVVIYYVDKNGKVKGGRAILANEKNQDKILKKESTKTENRIFDFNKKVIKQLLISIKYYILRDILNKEKLISKDFDDFDK